MSIISNSFLLCAGGPNHAESQEIIYKDYKERNTVIYIKGYIHIYIHLHIQTYVMLHSIKHNTIWHNMIVLYKVSILIIL